MNWLTDHLHEEWKQSWKWFSMQLNVLFSLIVAAVLADPDVLTRMVDNLPPAIKDSLPPVVGTIIFVIVALARLYKQRCPDVPVGK